ncbi:GNAT family N-acetyltransferase [Calidifontibacillus oryziterrae]|uniref:GNAT family N-acetyltransferase n=1 Tax=Calidifontibacillus oryziterrae TaxID=1191699 RepID=UPI000367CC0E|nr:GNAT family N-acetyltransferase [Calidifontibacillus oryziterrae]
MFIRRATEDETNYIQHFSKVLTEELSNGYMNIEHVKSEYMTSTIIARGGYYLVFQGDWGIVGWLLLGIDTNYYKNEPLGFVYELYVLPYYRSRGIGKALMQYALQIFRSQGMKSVQLNVFAGNPARKLYEKLGFTEVTSLLEYKIE